MKLEELRVALNNMIETRLSIKKYSPVGILLFERQSPFGKDRISFNLKESSNFYSVQAIHSRKYSIIEDYWYKYRETLDYGSDYEVLTLSLVKTDLNPELEHNPELRNLGNGREKLTSFEDVTRYVDLFLNELEQYIEPFFFKTENIQTLDSMLNESVETVPSMVKFFTAGTEFWFKRIIVAKLSGNEDYNKIYQWIRGRFMQGYQEKGLKKHLNVVQILDKINADLGGGQNK